MVQIFPKGFIALIEIGFYKTCRCEARHNAPIVSAQSNNFSLITGDYKRRNGASPRLQQRARQFGNCCRSGCNIINYQNFTILNICVHAKHIFNIFGACHCIQRALWRFRHSEHGIVRHCRDFVAARNLLGERVALVEAARHASAAGKRHRQNGIKRGAVQPRRRVFPHHPHKHCTQAALSRMFPRMEQRGQRGGIFGARPQVRVWRRMLLAMSAHCAADGELCAFRATVVCTGKQFAQVGQAA